jgi:hypothetical protein
MAAASIGASPAVVPPADATKPLLFAYFPSRDAARGSLAVPGKLKPSTQYDAKHTFSDAVVITLGQDDVFAQAYPGLKQALKAGLSVRLAEVQETAGREEQLGTVAIPLDAANYVVGSAPESAPVKHKLLTPTTLTLTSLPAPPTKTAGSPNAAQPGTQAEKASPTTWLLERLSDKKPHRFRVFVIVAPGLEIPTDKTLTISAK